MTESNITEFVNNSFPFFKSAYYIYFLFNTDCFLQIFTWIALGDADLLFSLIGV